MSIRQQIISAASSQLSASTGIVTVVNQRIPWWDLEHASQLPAVFVLEMDEKKKRFAFMSTESTAEDMYSELVLYVEGYCFDMTNDLSTKRTNLISDIELAITSTSGTLWGLTKDIRPIDVRTDQGQLDNWCIVKCNFLAKYVYNHASP